MFKKKKRTEIKAAELSLGRDYAKWHWWYINEFIQETSEITNKELCADYVWDRNISAKDFLNEIEEINPERLVEKLKF